MKKLQCARTIREVLWNVKYYFNEKLHSSISTWRFEKSVVIQCCFSRNYKKMSYPCFLFSHYLGKFLVSFAAGSVE